eukprot:TRINITY_DN11958_c0_g1_i1.p1 TRINITY_DN11958_c0_g1~~TRINITY_DN11958_c0_g1_i1.p1  ORF type:complete len:818 (-),score=109.47 TRINITY_DN11958_c0_g1_i1:98-2506(-)
MTKLSPVTLGDAPDPFETLTSSIIKTFFMVALGYIMGKTGALTLDATKGINQLAGKVALPALLFVGMATLNLKEVDFKVLLTMFLAKALVFVSVSAIAVVFSQKSSWLSKCGIFGIFVTQSNDVAIGLPIIQAMYPAYVPYIFLVALVQLGIINPLGFALLEASQAAQQSKVTGKKKSSLRTALRIFQGVITNPVVFMVLFGLIVNLILGGKLPSLIQETFNLAGSAFSCAALVSLGLSTVGKVTLLKGKGIIWPVVLVLHKAAIVSIASRYACGWIAPNDSDLSGFNFMYGALPTTPSVFVFATMYNAYPDVIAGSLVLCLVLSGFVMFSAAVFLIASSPAELNSRISDISTVLLCLSLAAAVILLSLAILLPNRRTFPNTVPHMLFFSQFGFALFALLCRLEVHEFSEALASVIYYFEDFFRWQCRLVSLVIIINLYVLGTRGQAYAYEVSRILCALTWAIPLLNVGYLLSPLSGRDSTPSGAYTCWYRYGNGQRVLGAIMLSLVSLIGGYFVIAVQRLYRNLPKGAIAGAPLRAPQGEKSSAPRSIPALTTLVAAGSVSGSVQSANLMAESNSVGDEHTPLVPPTYNTDAIGDRFRMQVIVLSQLLSAVLDLILTFTQFGPHEDSPTGLVAVQLLVNMFLFDGQGIISFFAYGTQTEVSDLIRAAFTSLRRLFRRTFFGTEDVSHYLLHPVAIPAEEQTFLQQLLDALTSPPSGLLADRTYGLKKYRQCFEGRYAVDWMVENKWAPTREAAVVLGQKLLECGWIHHVAFEHQFYDEKYFYQPTDQDDGVVVDAELEIER